MTAGIVHTTALHEALKLDDDAWYDLRFSYVEHADGDDIEVRECTCGSHLGRALPPAPISELGIGAQRGEPAVPTCHWRDDVGGTP